MKRWIGMLLGAVILAAVPAAQKINVLAAPVEAGMTTLSDAAFFDQEWAEKKLVISCAGNVWEKPVADLMTQEVCLYADSENGALSCKFVETDWSDEFLKQVEAALRSPELVNPAAPEGYCVQFVDGYGEWYVGVVQDRLLTGPVEDIEIELNEYTCKMMTFADAEAEVVREEEAEYVLAGTCTTSFRGSSAARINNIRIAAENMNGYILLPGETGSLDKIFKPRTSANGYRSAGVYLGGKLADGIGGGICQVSSTTYNALMNAGITVTERHTHSSPVSYLPLGTDAAISAGTLDLQFRNDYLHGIRLETVVEGKNLTVNVYVKEKDMNGVTYRLWAKKTSSMSAITYQTVYVNGVETEVREIGRCRYKPLIKEEEEDPSED